MAKNRFEEEFATCSLRHPDSFIHGNCDLCGTPLPRTKAGKVPKNRRWCSRQCSWTVTENHMWKWARKQALRRDQYTCVYCGGSGPLVKLEVNHTIPLVGSGYSACCKNHLDLLETVCGGSRGSCHVEITKAQRASRKNEK